jgi:DNA processing protein
LSSVKKLDKGGLFFNHSLQLSLFQPRSKNVDKNISCFIVDCQFEENSFLKNASMEQILAAADGKNRSSDSRFDWLTLYLTPGLGTAGCLRLVEHFGSPQKVLTAGKQKIASVKGLKKEPLQQLLNNPAYKKAENEITRAEKLGISIVSIDSPDYPQSLRSIHNPPVILYIKGAIEKLENKLLVAIVGSRAATTYGQKTAESLAYSMAGRGVIVVSGLALGVDAAAHKGALSAGGQTIGILGCGLDVVYPEQNRFLYRKIPESGAIISEYPFGTKPDSFRFPARNRIISGLSSGVLIVEASLKSGSLITAKHALEQGREVFAIPGRIDSIKSQGTHRLLQEGAKLVYHVDDILEEFIHLYSTKNDRNTGTEPPTLQLTDDENIIFSNIDVYPKTIDEIIQVTGLNANTVNEMLLHMELKGIIEVLPGNQYKKCIH